MKVPLCIVNSSSFYDGMLPKFYKYDNGENEQKQYLKRFAETIPNPRHLVAMRVENSSHVETNDYVLHS